MLLAFAGLTFVASAARADVFVSQLGDSQGLQFQVQGFAPASAPAWDKAPQFVDNTNFNRLALLTSILFFPGDTPPGDTGSGGTGGGGGGGGGGGPTPGSHEAPEPATFLTGLVGSCLLGFYATLKRRKAAQPAQFQVATNPG
jgi:hypothetical protein